MSLLLTDQIATLGADGAPLPIARAYVHAQPSAVPFFRKYAGLYVELQGGDIWVQANSTGIWQINLPWPSESKPTVTWQVTLPDGTVWAGSVPEGVTGPITIDQMVQVYGWGLVAGGGTTTISTVTGPAGPAGATGPAGGLNPRGAWLIGNNYAQNDSVSYAGSSYLALLANSGRQPDTNPTYWMVIANQGATGPGGTARAYDAVATGTCDNTGTTDTTARLVSSIAAAAATGYKRLYLPAGAYKLLGATGTILDMSTTLGLEIFGDGESKTILLLANNQTLTGNVTVLSLAGSYQSVHDLSIYGGTGTSGAFTTTFVSIAAGAFYPHLYNLELRGMYYSTNSTAGGAGIVSYQPWNQPELSTTLGTTVAGAGSATVTPPSMAGIYIGRTLYVGSSGADSTTGVVVTGMTPTTWTATFATAHASTDAVISYSQGNQYAHIENCSIHDAPYATGMILNSSSNVVRDCTIIGTGVQTNNQAHGIYLQGGNNLVEGCSFLGVGGYSIHGHKAVPNIDASGDRYIGNRIIDPGNVGIIVDSTTSGGTNPEIATGVNLTRYCTIADNVIHQNKNSQTATYGIQVTSGVQAIVSGNTIEDTATSAAIDVSGAPGSIVSGNIIRHTANFVPQGGSRCVDVGTNCVVEGNSFVTIKCVGCWNNSGTTGWIVRNNTYTLIAGGGIACTLNDQCQFVGNTVVTPAGGPQAFSFKAASPNGPVVRDNTFIVGAGAGYLAILQYPTGTYTIEGNTQFSSGDDGLLRYDNGGPGQQYANNEGLKICLGGYTGNTPTTRAMGRLQYLPKTAPSHGTGLLLKNVAGSVAVLTTTDTTFVGISIDNNGAASPTPCYFAGLPGTEFAGLLTDAAWTAGNIGIPSVTTAGRIHDTGSSVPPASGSFVLFVDSGAAAGSARVLVLKTY